MTRLRVKLTFPERLIKEPVIYNMIKKYDIVTNIRRANVEQKIGWIVLELDGNEADLEAALSYIEEVGVQVEQLDAGLAG